MILRRVFQKQSLELPLPLREMVSCSRVLPRATLSVLPNTPVSTVGVVQPRATLKQPLPIWRAPSPLRFESRQGLSSDRQAGSGTLSVFRAGSLGRGGCCDRGARCFARGSQAGCQSRLEKSEPYSSDPLGGSLVQGRVPISTLVCDGARADQYASVLFSTRPWGSRESLRGGMQ